MLLEILTTTDGQHLGAVINTAERPIVLSHDEQFTPDRVWQIGPVTWRLSSSNYTIDGKET